MVCIQDKHLSWLVGEKEVNNSFLATAIEKLFCELPIKAVTFCQI